MRRIVLAGGSGQIGSLLRRHFLEAGDQVVVLTRRADAGPGFVHWNGRTIGDWARELEGIDLLLNLCGRSVNCRYNASNRAEILASRIEPTRILGEAMTRVKSPPRVWMNASTATIYRHSFDKEMDEETGEIGGNEPDAPEKWRFSIEVATRWEETFAAAVVPDTRKIVLRSAVTMSPDKGGIFAVLMRLVRFGLGGTQGDGRQFVSWIHEDDFVSAVEFLLAHDGMDGVVNLASPCPLPNRDFMYALRAAAGVAVGIPATRTMLELGAAVIQTETELVLKSRRVVPRRLLAEGFRFRFPEWTAAANSLVRLLAEH